MRTPSAMSPSGTRVSRWAGSPRAATGPSRRAPRWRSATCPARWRAADSGFEIEIIGERRAAVRLSEPPFDPSRRRRCAAVIERRVILARLRCGIDGVREEDGCRAHQRPRRATPVSPSSPKVYRPRPISIRCRYERELQRIWYRNWVYVGRSSEIAAKRAFRTFRIGDQKILLVRDDAGQLQGLSQHLPSSGRGAVPRERGVAAHRCHRLSLSRLGIQPRGRTAAHLLQSAPGWVRSRRLSALRSARARVARLRVRVPRAKSTAARAALRFAPEPVGCLAPGRPRNRARALEDHREQLENLLGELQRVSALSRRSPETLEPRADLRAGAPRGARRSRVEPACGRPRSQVQGGPARRSGHVVDGRPSGAGRNFPD